ncbi:methyltransferase family protein [Rhizobium leguminosarum]|uniref:methyltransferase family protein n=1 Tax=Rhizobium leguminosarum TaxID=384 RepID=UPI001C92554A|nr:isoprenylcysteine carboxylmethyltransferase family protein [Rhizobium leguminosarum]MBY2912533.1 isoprenylcysteine carboxylmethyltransferase family protein [Rhizobium leguminosarum]MBY2968191.1 isoprenylcysteine carboxylmethyltransferase family protein [Rhizobium leguminosarum]MBY2975566.1 isoprenylcysteine carboxylmethyltransferase family protein [Rhizobium leguminosarum]MBY2997056.1 isoprenylcysteine carboxylmethyltransferase family protein [Rhizobium leguminosarum]MBY3004116.1 isoprenylc
MTTHTTSSDRPFKQKRRIWMLWALAAAFIVFHLVATPGFLIENFALTLFAQIGTLLVAFGVIGRVWSIIYVGGLKNSELVTEGPYSVTRNPLYLFSLFAISGVCLVFGSLVATATFTLLAYLVFRYAAKREALYLSHLFGERYAEYARRTPFFWPDLSMFRWGQVHAISRNALLVTTRDALFIFAMIPLSELVEYLRESGFLPMAITVL